MTGRLLLTLLAALAIATAAVVALARDRIGGREVVAELSTAPGVIEGTVVTYLGVRSGYVRTIDLSSGRVMLVLHIRRPDVPLHSNDGIRLRALGVFGDRMVEIVPGAPGGAPLGIADTLREAP